MQRYRNALVALVVIVGAGVLLYQIIYLYLLRPTLHVQGQAQHISIYTPSGAVVRDSATSTSFRLDSGTYLVKAFLPGGGIVGKIFSLSTRQDTTFALPGSAPKVGSAQLLTNALALEPVVSQSSLTYLDPTLGSFKSLDSSGTTNPLLPNVDTQGAGVDSSLPQVQQISPLPDGKELLVTTDGTPYYWDGSAVQPLSLAGVDTSNLNQEQVLFGSNAQDRDFVLSIDRAVYYYASADADPVQVATLKTRFNQLVFGGGKFVAFDTTMPYTTGNLAPQYATKYLVYPVLADVQAKTSTQLDQPLVSAAISPDGKQLVAKYRQQSQATLYQLNGASLESSLGVPRPDALAPLWTSGNTYVYSAAGALWSYDTSSGLSTALVDGLSLPPSSVALQPNNSIAYTELAANGQNGGVYQITARPQLDSKQRGNLVHFLLVRPPSTTDYSWTYSGIGQPTFSLKLTYPPGNGNPTESQAVEAFKTQLVAGGLNPNLFNVTATY